MSPTDINDFDDKLTSAKKQEAKRLDEIRQQKRSLQAAKKASKVPVGTRASKRLASAAAATSKKIPLNIPKKKKKTKSKKQNTLTYVMIDADMDEVDEMDEISRRLQEISHNRIRNS